MMRLRQASVIRCAVLARLGRDGWRRVVYIHDANKTEVGEWELQGTLNSARRTAWLDRHRLTGSTSSRCQAPRAIVRGKSSGCMISARISRPSTMRGPGRLK